MYKPIILFFLAVLISVSVLAVQPTVVVGQFSEGYLIKYPLFTYLKQNQDQKFEFHVFNQSNGLPIFNATAGCLFHLYNSSGNHLYTQTVRNMEETYDFEVTIKGANFSKIGSYVYMFQCNSTNYGGFVSEYVEVNKLGRETLLTDIILYIIVLFILLAFISFGIYGIWKSELIGKSLYIVLVYIFMIALFFVSFNMVNDYTNSTFLIWFLRFCFMFLMWSFIPFLMLLFFFMITQLRKARGINELIEKGIPEDEAIKRIMRKR